jgi:hypothetical protein
MDMEFVLPERAIPALIAVIGVILLDTIFGILLAIRDGRFDFRKLPKFLITNVFPYCGGLAVLALMAEYLSVKFEWLYSQWLFNALAAPVSLKFLIEAKDKIVKLFGVNLQ